MSTTSTQRMQKWRRETKQKRLLADAFVHDRDMSVDDTPDDEVVDKIVEFAEGLIVPSGMLSNKPFILPDWQVEFLRGALAPGVREAGLSVARKNGKSGLIALLLLAFLTGTVRRRGWRALVCSLTGRLAMELWLAMEALIVRNQLLSVEMKKTPQPGVAFGVGDTRVDFLAADRASGHAVGADLAIVDEAGLLTERERPLWNAMMPSSQSAACIKMKKGIPSYSPSPSSMIMKTVNNTITKICFSWCPLW